VKSVQPILAPAFPGYNLRIPDEEGRDETVLTAWVGRGAPAV
jgi:hypothetical protein